MSKFLNIEDVKYMRVRMKFSQRDCEVFYPKNLSKGINKLSIENIDFEKSVIDQNIKIKSYLYYF